MERSTSTVDKNSLKADLTQEFTHLSPIPIKDLKVFIFMKPNAEDLDPYMIHVISFLQKYEIACYVTEEACASLKQDKEARSKAEVNNASIPEYDLDKLTIFSDSNQREINRIITLGGDGTVVQAIKLFYKDKCPLMITFGQESIGENYEAVLFYSLINIAEDYDPSLVDRKINEEEEEKYGDPYVETRERVVLKVGFDNEEMSVKSSFNPQKKKKVKFGTLYALNEITVDRGGFNYLTNIECYINGYFLTVIQGDGVIISSPTGSTAYNMSAGGSIVYNYVNSLLLTPICPHSLSFRPLILPDTCCITLKASKNSRCDYYTVSLDGDSRFEIKRGEKIDIEGCMCTLPFVTFNPKDPMETWCERLNSSLHWNSRPIQKEFKNK